MADFSCKLKSNAAHLNAVIIAICTVAPKPSAEKDAPQKICYFVPKAQIMTVNFYVITNI